MEPKCLSPPSLLLPRGKGGGREYVHIYISLSCHCSLISVGCWMCVHVSSRVSAIKHLPVLEGKRFFSVCTIDSETCLFCRKSCRINVEYFDIQQWKSTCWHVDLGRLCVSFLLTFYAARSWVWLTECNFRPRNSLLGLNPQRNKGTRKPSPVLLNNQAISQLQPWNPWCQVRL